MVAVKNHDIFERKKRVLELPVRRLYCTFALIIKRNYFFLKIVIMKFKLDRKFPITEKLINPVSKIDQVN